MSGDYYRSNAVTVTDALENLKETIREIELGCSKTMEECGICDDDDLIIFALNYINANADDIFYDLLEEDEE